MFHYYQIAGGEETWQAIPASRKSELIAEHRPMFVTVLPVSKVVEDLPYEEKLKLAYIGPFYADWDSKDEKLVIEKTNQFLDKLEEMGVDLEQCHLYATGGKGYHLEVPPEIFMEKVPAKGVVGLPIVYKEMALAMTVDTLDLRVYSAQRGRMWRQPNVKRENGRYKVPVSLIEMREMTPELNAVLTATPRQLSDFPVKPPTFCVKLSIEYTKAAQRVEELLKKRAKHKPDPRLREKATSESILWMMSGLGIKPDVGFHQLSLQLATAAATAGWSEEKFVEECKGLIETHTGDGSRYNTEGKRREELARMFRYVSGNPCYEFSIGAIKSLLEHPALDLDGITQTKEEVKEAIDDAVAQRPDPNAAVEQDEYEDVARGITLLKNGIFGDTEYGKKRLCSVSFANACVLRSMDTRQIVGYDADVMVNGKFHGTTTLELDIFSGLVPFNRFVAKYGHAFQGSDAQVRVVMMRFVEQAKKSGGMKYVVTREGLDMVAVAGHEDVRISKPFMVWADNYGVTMEPRAAAAEISLKYAGFPDPRGVFRSDIALAPKLVDWVQDPANKTLLLDTLKNMMTCQRPEVLGKLIGWYTACFWKPLFQKVHGKFPLLHVNGPAGLGKTELNIALSSIFYYQQECRPLSPGSTNFALTQHLTASASIPLILDEYKPHEMRKDRHDSLKALFRDAYNQRDTARGGGSRDGDDYRNLQFSQLAAPLAFIAEAAEEESAVMERVVLVTLARPHQLVGVQNYSKFQAFQRNKHLLGILGQYLATSIIHDATIESFSEEFKGYYDEARAKFMLSEADISGGLDDEAMKEKQNTKERPVYNHTVARFGFIQFRRLVNEMFDNELDPIMAELEDGIYARLSDLHASTTPEYVKVLREISNMSYHVEVERPEAVRKNHEYAFADISGRGLLELSVRTAYTKYRMYCRAAQTNPLFGGVEAFIHAVQDSPAFVKKGSGTVLNSPGTFTFDVEELARLGVDIFKK
jgi:hypothetical protein